MPAILRLTDGRDLVDATVDAQTAMRKVNAALEGRTSGDPDPLPAGWIEVAQDEGPVYIYASQVVSIEEAGSS